MRLQGTPGAQSVPLAPSPDGDTLGSAPPRLLQAALSVLGYVEADKENGESLWVAPSVPAVPGPGDTPSLLPLLGQNGERPRTHVVPPVPRLVPRVQGSRNYRDPALWELPGCGGGRRSWTETLPALCDGASG